MTKLLDQLKKIKAERSSLGSLSLTRRNQILKALAKNLIAAKKDIINANKKDIKALKRTELTDRLKLNEERIEGMAKSLLKIAKQSDPLNKILEIRKPKNGLLIKKLSAPLGTVGVIYESRPNVTIDLAGLAIKSGNALVLKGGSEAYFSNQILVRLIHKALTQYALSSNLVYLINPTENWQKTLMNASGLVDVLIPRGGAGLIAYVRENARVPIIETGAGVCHTFVDEGADVKKAGRIIINAKIQRPSVCNSLDTLVVHKKIMPQLLQNIAGQLAHNNVEIFADEPALKELKKNYPLSLLHKAVAVHYGVEFLSLKMSIKTTGSFQEGLKFVQTHTSGHSEAILTKNENHAAEFLNSVDSAAVYLNASTRFTDGEEFGMGGEVGISTQKLHARGPMGAEALTSYKWVIKGNGQIRK